MYDTETLLKRCISTNKLVYYYDDINYLIPTAHKLSCTNSSSRGSSSVSSHHQIFSSRNLLAFFLFLFFFKSQGKKKKLEKF